MSDTIQEKRSRPSCKNSRTRAARKERRRSFLTDLEERTNFSVLSLQSIYRPLAGRADFGVADPDYVADKAKEFIKVLGVLSAFFSQDIGDVTPVPGHSNTRPDRVTTKRQKSAVTELSELWLCTLLAKPALMKKRAFFGIFIGKN